jgi:cation/acetate symporter
MATKALLISFVCVSMTVSFIVGIVVSLMTKEETAEAAFDDEKLRTYLGIGAE